MLRWTAMALTLSFSAAGAAAQGPCRPGIYGTADEAFVVLGAAGTAGSGQRYLFRDGRRGSTDGPGAAVTCEGDIATVAGPDGAPQSWPRRETRETDTTFDSAATRLAGQLVEPAGPPDPARPLVVMVHGSERTAAIGSVYAYMLAAQGVSVFVYDKRGTGASDGTYTQNFELLAADAAAALEKARSAAAGRFGRTGFFGGSQGGWVAPLAATRTPADFVAIGFGLVVSPIEEDRAQLLEEARRMGLAADEMAQVERLSDATAELVRTHFARGFEALEAVRREIGDAPWAATIAGEYSGDMLRMSDADLRRIGRARFDNLELIWDYDAKAALAKLDVPLLWVLAEDDREAPIERTRAVLAELAGAGQSIDVYLFPDTDHGMMEYRENADGSRTGTRITDGYLRLLADWIKRDVQGPYGRGEKL
ncbi:alpha/beta hydrolase family protein [Pelagerythrobacter rhizovicinus]|uniref:Alpha/beta hydrolase n=1 Tax=Pelagerythrobacter rhizovicinus TaxID=2268576 RepID=A0A4Q2KLP5_9SPHN|nr:alpha/beta hydrolase [Pelagerythrobacter rhizovicinus]RXZ64061.1 alpha/beta hydrolase [Pelagerythrobacter rhizovicinus]